MFGHGVNRLIGALALQCPIVLLALLLVACGSGSRTIPATHPSSLEPAASPQVNLSDTLAELHAATPDDVDAALFLSLKSELAKRLALTGVKSTSRVPKKYIEFLQPSVSLPSTRPPFTFGWNSSFFWTDGSQDGIVTVQDLTPIATHFGEAVEDVPQAEVADYNRDGVVSIADLTPFAADLGVNVDHFKVGLVIMGTQDWMLEEYPPEPLASISYSSSTGEDESGFNAWEFDVETVPNQSMFWMSVTPVDAQGEEGAMCFLRARVSWHVPFQVDDLAVDPNVEPPDIGVTWTSAFFKGDGLQDGVVNIGDITPPAVHFADLTSEVPEATVADYDGNGIVNMGDVGVVGQYFGRNCGAFDVEVSTVSPGDGYEVNGNVGWSDQDEVNEFGFKVFRYTIADPPETRPFWIRVTPREWDGDPGIPSEPLEIAE